MVKQRNVILGLIFFVLLFPLSSGDGMQNMSPSPDSHITSHMVFLAPTVSTRESQLDLLPQALPVLFVFDFLFIGILDDSFLRRFKLSFQNGAALPSRGPPHASQI